MTEGARDTYTAFLGNLERYRGIVVPLRGVSCEVAASFPRPVDFLFIDGDHTESGVAQDYNDYKGFVRPGGIIAFHDIIENQPLPDNLVYHFWKKVKSGLVTEEFVDDPKQCGFGIGIIRVPP